MYEEGIVLRSATLLATAWTVALGFAAAGEAEAQPSCPRVDLTLIESSASSETRPVDFGGLTIFVRRTAITTTSDISEIEVLRDEARNDGEVLLIIEHTAAAAARLLDATTDRDGRKWALVVDDDAWLVFVWEGPNVVGPDRSQLSISNLTRAQELVESIRGCAEG